MTTDKSQLVSKMIKRIAKQYAMQPETMEDMTQLLIEVLAPYYIYNVPMKSKKRQNSKPRALTSYNVFVKEHMSEFKELPQKERMSQVSKLWQEHKKTTTPSVP